MDGAGTTETNRAAGGGLAEIGVMLRRRREEVGQDLRTISAATHIKQIYLKAIEDGRRKELPGTAYMIGYIRTYADYLGFDGNRLITDYHAELAGHRKRDEKRAEAAEPPPAAGVAQAALPPVIVIAAMVVLILAIYGAWAFLSRNGSDEDETQTAAVETPQAPAPEPAPAEPPTPAVDQAAKPPAPSPSGAEASAPAEPAPAPAPSETPSATEDQVPPEADVASTGEDVTEESPPQQEPAADAEAKAGKIVVRARLESWIQITNANKEVVFSRVLRAGETYTVPEEETGLTLTTGNAGGVEILLNGKKLKSLGTVGLVKRDIPLDAKKLKDGSAFKATSSAQ